MGILFEINQQIGTMNEEGIILGYTSFFKNVALLNSSVHIAVLFLGTP